MKASANIHRDRSKSASERYRGLCMDSRARHLLLLCLITPSAGPAPRVILVVYPTQGYGNIEIRLCFWATTNKNGVVEKNLSKKYFFIMKKIDFEVGDIEIFFSTFFRKIFEKQSSKNQ